jgi:hypothetical protein
VTTRAWTEFCPKQNSVWTENFLSRVETFFKKNFFSAQDRKVENRILSGQNSVIWTEFCPWEEGYVYFGVKVFIMFSVILLVVVVFKRRRVR